MTDFGKAVWQFKMPNKSLSYERRMVGLCPTPHQGTEYPGPAIAEFAWLTEKALFPLLLGEPEEARLDAVVLLARRLKAAKPGCFASGESQGKIRRGKLAFPLGFSRAFLGQKPSNVS